MARFVLGAFSSTLSGKSGTTVFVRTAGGVVVRDRVVPRDPRTLGQSLARGRMGRASQAWSALSAGQRAAWEAYARSMARPDPETGLPVAPRAMNLFTGQYAKLLQIQPAAPPPASPPAHPFFGDAVSVTVAPSLDGPCAPSPALPLGRLDGGPEGLPGPGGPTVGSRAPSLGPGGAGPPGGGVTFTADRPNAPGVVTELLLQPLASAARRAYRDKYRTQAFVAFAPGALSATVAAAPGWHACGVRFVDSATGQATPVVELGAVRVAP